MFKAPLLVLLCAALPRAFASDLILHGKVTMEDGSPPGRPVTIERVCIDTPDPIREATTNSRGEYTLRLMIDGITVMSLNRTCVLRVSGSTYYSTTIDLSDWRWFSDPNLPNIQLLNRAEHAGYELFSDADVPRAASKAWARATKAAGAQDWKEAEFQLRVALKIHPKFAAGWHALGAASEQLGDVDGARQAQRRAVELNPRLLTAWVMLGRLDLAAQDWKSALATSASLAAADTKKRYPEAHIQRAVAQFYLHELDAAQSSAEECLRVDRNHDLPRAEYILGLILESKHSLDAAREHLERYLAIAPRASDAGFVRTRLANLGSAESSDIGLEMKQVVARLQPAPAGDVWVPGGIRALAAIANIQGPTSPARFFADYCRTLVRETTPGLSFGIPAYRQRLRAYMASITELARMGDRRGDKTTIRLSLDEAHRKNTERVLNLFGWKITKDGAEIGDLASDGLRQDFPAALGVDPVAMQDALNAGRVFEIEIASDNSRLAGGDAWGLLIKDLPSYPGGIAEAFARDHRLARTCAGLSAMSPEASAIVIAGIGLGPLVEKLAEPVALYGASFTLTGDAAAAPGSEEAWTRLAGVSPRKPAPFFRAVLERDQGALAAFYSALAEADAAHQRYFTSTAARAEKFYAWYRDSGEMRWSMYLEDERWRRALLHDLPLDANGNLRFPGDRAAWTTARGADEDVLPRLASLQALLHAAQLEQHRGRPLDSRSAALIAQFDSEWRPLFPYFEQIKELDAAEFEALARFTAFAAKLPEAGQNAALAEWSALVELIARGRKAGALDDAAAARAFGKISDALASPDHDAKAVELARGFGGIDLLRLNPQRRAAFDHIMTVQGVPAPGDPAKAAAALTGMIYAATLDPNGLLVNADPLLISKHQFTTGAPLFAPASLESLNHGPGSRFHGGFSGFSEIASKLARGRAVEVVSNAAPGEAVPVGAATVDAEPVAAEAVFRASGRLVEVFATVTDSRGRYVDDLKGADFSIAEEGRKQPIVGFEPRSSEVSVALLLDTTGSMQAALPSLKNAALKLISELRPEDSAAVYSFNNTVTERQPFTTEKDGGKRAILTTSPWGETALYDALVRVNRDLAGRTGKKVIIVFTDGDDNVSTLTSQAAIRRAKGAGVPVYTIAQGEAVAHPELLKQLAEISQSTGGSAFVIHNAGEVRAVFEKISQDLQHGYFFLFQPASTEGHEWHSIDVRVRGASGLKTRARDGYYPE